MGNIRQRLRRLRAVLRRRKLDGLVATNVHNVRYLSGFSGEDSALLVGLKGCVLVTDSRYTETAEKELGPCGIAVHQRKKSLVEALAAQVRRRRLRRVGFEAADMSVDLHGRLCEEVKRAELRPTVGLVRELRQIKDASEIRRIREAVRVAEEGLRATLGRVRPGVTEKDVATELDHQMRRLGAEESAFPLIVAAGERASLPHARPTGRKLAGGEAVLIDWGARLEFYNSDLTRVFFLGTIPRGWQSRYDAVLRAQEAALQAVRPGVVARTVDGAARRALKRRRLANRFGHGLGHGVGLEIHENPGLNNQSETELKPGMVFTVEPGIYFPDWGGIRIEDMVLITSCGKEVLTRFEKQATQLVI